ncbi:MAG: LysM peptidoglycan-binding domain-containing protein [Clostridiales bacterium]
MNYTKRMLLFALVSILIIAFSANIMAAEIYDEYTVKEGDTVYKISNEKGIPTNAIVNANGLDNGGKTIYPNMVLVLDSNAGNTVNANYTVKYGDSLYKIAQAYGTTVSTLIGDNGMVAERIYVGQQIYVPQKAEAVTPKTQTKTATTENNYVAENQNANPLSLSDEEIYMMAKMIYGEARGESYQGQVAVGAVILNRIKSSSFPNTMEGVLFQNKQFSAVGDGQYYLSPNDSALKAAREAAKGADPTYGSTFYWNPVKAPNNSFLNAKPIITTIGSHVFAG